jgi:hypothetical protein
MTQKVIIGLAAVAAGVVMLGNVSTAQARLPTACKTTPPAPAQCTGRDLTGFRAGLGQGTSTVDQIWESAAIGQNPDNWETLIAQVTTTIPNTVAVVRESTWSNYLLCRTQGLLDGAVCRMNEIDPIPGCQLDGVDWGKMSASIYCNLSDALNGLGDVEPWFIRPSPGMCGGGFQSFCEDVYRFGATHGADPLASQVETLLTARGILSSSLLQSATCPFFTQDHDAPVPDFKNVFEDSVLVDCSYVIP